MDVLRRVIATCDEDHGEGEERYELVFHELIKTRFKAANPDAGGNQPVTEQLGRRADQSAGSPWLPPANSGRSPSQLNRGHARDSLTAIMKAVAPFKTPELRLVKLTAPRPSAVGTLPAALGYVMPMPPRQPTGFTW